MASEHSRLKQFLAEAPDWAAGKVVLSGKTSHNGTRIQEEFVDVGPCALGMEV